MYDVIGAYQRLEYIYKLYIKSTFPLCYKSLSQEREKILNRTGILSQPPSYRNSTYLSSIWIDLKRGK